MKEKCRFKGILEGICTNQCPHRSTCKLQRVPFLIRAVVINHRKKTIFSDAYINEISYLKARLGRASVE